MSAKDYTDNVLASPNFIQGIHIILWLTDSYRGFCALSEEKKPLRSQLVGYFSLFWLFSDKNTTNWVKKNFFWHDGGKNKYRSNVRFFSCLG